MLWAIFNIVLLCAAGAAQAQTGPAVAAPRIGVILEDLALALDEPPFVLDLVVGLVGDVEIYRVSSGDAEIVTAQVAGSHLTLTPAALGATTVAVSATNGWGSAFQEFRVTVVAGRVPEIVSLIDEPVLVVGDPPVEIDVSAAFSGGVLAYDATSGDPNLVRVQVVDSRMSLVGLAAGTTRVSVFATGVAGAALQTVRVQVIEAAAPAVVDPLPDRTLTVGDPPWVVDVSPAFSGNGLGYTATAGDPGVVRLEMSGSSLSLTGVAAGVTTVSVDGENPLGSALQSFRVTVQAPGPAGTGRPGPVQENPTG